MRRCRLASICEAENSVKDSDASASRALMVGSWLLQESVPVAELRRWSQYCRTRIVPGFCTLPTMFDWMFHCQLTFRHSCEPFFQLSSLDWTRTQINSADDSSDDPRNDRRSRRLRTPLFVRLLMVSAKSVAESHILTLIGSVRRKEMACFCDPGPPALRLPRVSATSDQCRRRQEEE